MADIKYLNKDGLAHFLGKLKTYIEDRIKSIYGTDIYISNDNSKTNIKDYIDSVTKLDNETSIKEALEEIIESYVKSIVGAESDDENINKYFKVIVNEITKDGTGTGNYEIYLEDNGFIEFVGKYTNHVHPITLQMSSEEGGDIECSFGGEEDDTDIVTGFEDGENTVKADVSHINSTTVVTKLPEFTEIELPTKEHTHSITIKPSGTINSTFTGTDNTHEHNFEGTASNTENSNLTINYLDASCTLSISTSHNHRHTPIGTIKSTTIKPAGTINSTFTGTENTWTAIATTSTGNFYNKTADGETANVTNIEIPGPGHTHKYTPSGEVTVKISYDGETGIPTQEK